MPWLPRLPIKVQPSSRRRPGFLVSFPLNRSINGMGSAVGAAMEFERHLAVPAVFRGRRLTDAHTSAMPPLRVEAGDQVVASQLDRPVWIHRPAVDGRRCQRMWFHFHCPCSPSALICATASMAAISSAPSLYCSFCNASPPGKAGNPLPNEPALFSMIPVCAGCHTASSITSNWPGTPKHAIITRRLASFLWMPSG